MKNTLNKNYAAPSIEQMEVSVEQGFSLSGGTYPGGDVEINPMSVYDDSYLSGTNE
ncbi:MAG: hypothetical protein RR330_04350 [Alistipes sp.]